MLRVLMLAFALFGAAAPAIAQPVRVGPFSMGMSESEADRAAPAALRFDPVGDSGLSIARGEAQFFDAAFDVHALFYWNAGLRTLALRHSDGEAEPACRALAARAMAEISSAFGIVIPAIPDNQYRWDARFSTEQRAHGEWQVEWNASWQRGWGENYCHLAIRISGAPPFVADPPWREFAEIEPIAGPPVWLSEPSLAQVRRLNPPRAVERGQSGVVVLACRVSLEGALSCAIANEQPIGWGYGEAALAVSRIYRIAPEAAGEATAGRKLQMVVDFVDVERRPHIGVE